MTSLGSGPDPFDWLAAAARERFRAGLHREPPVRASGGRAPLDLAGNDYLGLSVHPGVVAAAAQAAAEWGTGATGSRLVTGTTALHVALERALAAFLDAEAALVFSSGYTANLAAVTALAGPGDLVVSDSANHASLVDACRLSRARVVVTRHRDVEQVAKVLAGRPERRALVVTDGVFSAAGDTAPLVALHEACDRAGAALLVDEAHSLGTVGGCGQGTVAAAGLAGSPRVVRTVTLSKALGSQGGAVVGRADVCAHLSDTARSFIFDTALAPPAAGAALAALDLLTPGRVAALRAAVLRLAAAARVPAGQGPVLGIILGEPGVAVSAAAAALAAGVRVGCFRPPSVPPGTSRLRISARADLSADQLALGCRVLAALPGDRTGCGPVRQPGPQPDVAPTG